MNIIKIHTPYILLHQALKIAGIIDTGGAAKYFLQENVVLVNNEPENRRGRKLYPGDSFSTLKKDYLITSETKKS